MLYYLAPRRNAAAPPCRSIRDGRHAPPTRCCCCCLLLLLLLLLLMMMMMMMLMLLMLSLVKGERVGRGQYCGRLCICVHTCCGPLHT